MITYANGSRILQSVDELPNFSAAKELFLDVETTSFTPAEMAVFPYRGHRIAGIACTFDNCEHSWYIPIRHTDKKWNLPLEPVLQWLRAVISSPIDWINHSVCFDAHFCSVDGAEFGGRLIDTLSLSKLLDSDRMTYGLKELCREWCNLPMAEKVEVDAYLKGIHSKNYGDVPADIMGRYATMDVLGNRALWRYIQEHRYDSLSFENEIKLTPVLFDTEKFGMPVDPMELNIQKALSLQKQIMYGTRIKELTGIELNPASPNDIYDILINQMGLPVLMYGEMTQAGEVNPCFDKEALAMYVVHPTVLADPIKKEAVRIIKEYRDEKHFCSLFLDGFLNLMCDAPELSGTLYKLLHPSYNQIVRTGRMSCRKPNAQQLNKRAKRLIHPRKGMAILDADESQIEFRLLAHIIGDTEAIKSYNDDPTTDFHAWVAGMCGVKRKAAKCLNFGMGFGAGQKKIVQMLVANPDVIDTVSAEVALISGITEDQRHLIFKEKCVELATSLYHRYHERLPGIKDTSSRIANVAKIRGYVFNLYKRRRHLLPKFARKGLNTWCQSSAADTMKDTMIRTAPRYNRWLRELDFHHFSSVHDSYGAMAPIEVVQDPGFQREYKSILEDKTIKISIPLVVEMGWSSRDWAEAGCEKPIYDGDRCVASPCLWEPPK